MIYNKCTRKDCVFHAKGQPDKCLLPPNQNFYVRDEYGWIKACLNHLIEINQLSLEGRQRLMMYRRKGKL